ncbi:hypothetical protein CCP4SC76_1830001 [Gammaproteobacteria bacterium]
MTCRRTRQIFQNGLFLMRKNLEKWQGTPFHLEIMLMDDLETKTYKMGHMGEEKMSKLYKVEITHMGYVVIDNDDEINDGSIFQRWRFDITNDDSYPEYSWSEIKSVPVDEDPRICVYHKGKGYITIADFLRVKRRISYDTRYNTDV